MKRDTLYYQLFKRFPNLLFELVEHPPIDRHRYQFQSVEVKETAFRIDGVFLPPEDASPKIVFFAEVQFQKDEALYHRFFTESLLYLYRNQATYDDWYGVIIFPSRSLEPNDLNTHRALLASEQIQRIYLDELGNPSDQPVGINLMQLTIVSEIEMTVQARQLIERVNQEEADTLRRREIIEVITTIAVYKFSNLSREEVESMLGLSLEETRVYQEAKAEGEQIGQERGEQQGRLKAKLETVPRLLDAGLSVEKIAEILELSVEEVEQAALNQSQGD